MGLSTSASNRFPLLCSPRLGSGDLWHKRGKRHVTQSRLTHWLSPQRLVKHTPSGETATTLSLATKTSSLKGSRAHRTDPMASRPTLEQRGRVCYGSRRARSSAWKGNCAAASTNRGTKTRSKTTSSPTHPESATRSTSRCAADSAQQIRVQSLTRARAVVRSGLRPPPFSSRPSHRCGIRAAKATTMLGRKRLISRSNNSSNNCSTKFFRYRPRP